MNIKLGNQPGEGPRKDTHISWMGPDMSEEQKASVMGEAYPLVGAGERHQGDWPVLWGS